MIISEWPDVSHFLCRIILSNQVSYIPTDQCMMPRSLPQVCPRGLPVLDRQSHGQVVLRLAVPWTGGPTISGPMDRWSYDRQSHGQVVLGSAVPMDRRS